MIQPAFHKHKLQLLTTEMASCTEQMLTKWESEYPNKQFNIVTEMMALTLQIVGKTLLNADVLSEAKNVGDSLGFLLRAVNIRTRAPVLLPLWIPIPHHQKIKSAVSTINKVLDKIFDDRRSNPSDRYDLLSMLMEARYEDTGEPMDNKQLRDEVMTIFVAGHETTANALAWTLYLLLQNSESMQKCKEELSKVLNGRTPVFDDLSQLKY